MYTRRRPTCSLSKCSFQPNGRPVDQFGYRSNKMIDQIFDQDGHLKVFRIRSDIVEGVLMQRSYAHKRRPKGKFRVICSDKVSNLQTHLHAPSRQRSDVQSGSVAKTMRFRTVFVPPGWYVLYVSPCYFCQLDQFAGRHLLSMNQRVSCYKIRNIKNIVQKLMQKLLVRYWLNESKYFIYFKMEGSDFYYYLER